MTPVFSAFSLAKSNEFSQNCRQLIPPLVLAGNGADEYCKGLGVGIVHENGRLLTERTRADYEMAKESLCCSEKSQNQAEISVDGAYRLDTVGGVSMTV